MALKVEGVVDGSMNTEEALRRGGGLETLHLALSSSDRLMRVLGAVVGRQPLPMAAGQAQVADAAP
jgi:hypothetical protein